MNVTSVNNIFVLHNYSAIIHISYDTEKEATNAYFPLMPQIQRALTCTQ